MTQYDDYDLDIIAKTIWAEARGEGSTGQTWVAWVIKNRSKLNRSYWGGSKISAICLQPKQFECWNNGDFNVTSDVEIYHSIRVICRVVLDSSFSADPTQGSDHYNNPDKEGKPDWTKNCTETQKIGNHQFYRGNN